MTHSSIFLLKVWRFYYLVTDGRNIMVESIFFFSRSSEVRGEVIWMMVMDDFD